MTKMFMDMDYHILKTYEKTNCLNATNIPCWVPQMKDIVEYETQKNLEKCTTLMDYNCEKMVLYHSMIDIGLDKCPRPCDKLHYKLIKGEVYQIPNEDYEWVSVITFFKVRYVNNGTSIYSTTQGYHWHLKPRQCSNTKKKGYD